MYGTHARKRTRRIKRGSRTTKQRSRTEGSERVGQRNKEAVQRGAREPDNETKKPYRGSKRVGQRNKEAEQRNKESQTTKQREPNNGTKRDEQRNKESRITEQREPDRATRKPNNETKRDGQESEGAEHPLTFGYYVNIQIGK